MSPGMVLMHGSSKNILVFGVSSLIRTIFSYKVENGPKTSIFDLQFCIGRKLGVFAAFAQKLDSVTLLRSKTNRKTKKHPLLRFKKMWKIAFSGFSKIPSFKFPWNSSLNELVRLQWCGSCAFYAHSSHLVVIHKVWIVWLGCPQPIWLGHAC